jgi:hypothetical protein
MDLGVSCGWEYGGGRLTSTRRWRPCDRRAVYVSKRFTVSLAHSLHLVVLERARRVLTEETGESWE